MADVAILVKDVGLKPTVQWVTDRFDVELEEEEGQNMIPKVHLVWSRSRHKSWARQTLMRQKVKMQGGIPAEPEQVRSKLAD